MEVNYLHVRHGLLFSSLFVLCCHVVTAQQNITLKTGTFPLLKTSSSSRVSNQDEYHFFKVDHTLLPQERLLLKQKGIEILYALHDHIYWVKIKGITDEHYSQYIFDINPLYKNAISGRGEVNKLRVTIAPGMSLPVIKKWAGDNSVSLLDTRALQFGFMDVELEDYSIAKLINTPWISFIEPIPQDEQINFRLLNAERGWGLKSPLTRNLDGTGMIVGIGDGGRLGSHQDLSSSVLDLASFGKSDHATQVTGIITGAGLLDPAFGFGYAPNAHILVRNFSDILWASPQYIADFGMSLTNNSYGVNLTDCTYIGDYNGTSAALDAMILAYPSLLHVFAAANSGGLTCTPYPTGYATISGGYQPAKNVLTVGAITITDLIAGFSSRGPVEDGRLKPEVVAYGQGRFSTIDNNNYASNSGTSFSSPSTTGTATLLYQRYRQLHNDSLPDAALIKNVICNGADDLGTSGPDFLYGFGRINGVRSVEILESNHYTSVLVDDQQIITKTITVPSGEASIDIMLMWSDQASAPYETVTLVNDLDIIVISPTGDTIKPWRLNYTPSGVSSSATTGADHLNNYEQITIQTPVSGTYTIRIKGYNIPLGPQLAWLSWDIQHAGITVQTTDGGEIFKPNDTQYIRWDAYGTGASTFTVQYKTSAGGAWTNIASGIPSNQRYQVWVVPNTPTYQLKVRVLATNGMQDSSNNNAIILAPPGNLIATSPCNGYIQMVWNAVTGADYYEIYSLENEVLTLLDTTHNTSITLGGFAADSSTWVTVGAVISSDKKGLRAKAVLITPSGGNQCTWNHDLRLDSITEPVSGRKFTSSALSLDTVRVHITNEGTMNAAGFSLSYSINNGSAITQSFIGTLNAGAGNNFKFTQPANLSATGDYNIRVWTNYASDPLHQNDTISTTIRHLPNPVITLPWTEDFESVPDVQVLNNQTGLPGLDKWDADLDPTARIRTFAGSPFCHSGERALTVDATQNDLSKNANLLLTLNLAGYSVNNDDILMSLDYMHHEIIPDVTNTEAIWIRGSDTDTFLLLTNLPNEAALRGIYHHLAGLRITTLLDQHDQDFSSSFQVKFSHDVIGTAGQTTSEDGQTIDDISFTRIQRDITVDQLNHPQSISCGLGIETIEVHVSNTTNKPVDSTSVSWQVNGGTIHSMPIGTISGNASINVMLNPTFDFSIPGTYNLVAWVFSPQDDFHDNDTLRIQIVNSALITVFPYREGFESGGNGWLSGGINSTWMTGAPGKEIISHAAEGKKIWTTNLSGTHNPDETSYLYSPCFDFTGFTQPFLSFAFQYQLEAGFDYAWVEYRVEGTEDWIKLGTQGSGTNWYNDPSNRWNGTQSRWITTGIQIPVTNMVVQFRWVMQSDVGVELEGIAIDQINIYDRVQIYNGAAIQMTLPVSGNNWIHFDQGGQRIFSLNPEGQNLGNVTLSLFKSGQNFLLTDSIYLLSRNWVLTSSLPAISPVKLRGYFTSTEANNLVNATGCSQCILARDGFDVTSLRYSGPNEDGQFNNNISTQVITYPLDSTEIHPYENGYYAEWNTVGLSEWWITSQVTKKSGQISRRVSGVGDDAEEHQDNGSVNPVREVIAMTKKNGQQAIGWRFKNITIPLGSYIKNARIKWTSRYTSSSSANWTLRSELSADASTFITRKYNITLRPQSNQVVEWQPVNWSLVNTEYASPDIRHLIQNIVDQPTWKTGNDLVLIMKGSGLRESWSYDGDPLKGAELVLDYDFTCLAAGTLYVNRNATGLQDGSSWVDAYRSFEQALDRAAHCPAITQIWLAGGTYLPFPEVSRNTGFMIRPGLSIYGGFQGNETNVNQRVLGLYPTLLSGDIGTANISGDNVYHVLTISGGGNVLLDGLTVQGGMANGGIPSLQTGSGIYNQGTLTCQQVTLVSNSAPAFFNAPGSMLISNGLVEVKP
ncbi:MAG TPA: S8 family serine peptidase [Saprospiraceae bacterium]|nr:S8 family serine peptidase [Saprospiraceae bacterium]